MRIGNAEIFVVSDGASLTDGGGFFGLVPRVLWEKVCRPDDLNRVPSHLRSLLVFADDKVILVDTGYGDKLSPKMKRNLGMEGSEDGRLIRDLAKHGVAPEDVDIVINTHLHADHCGGNTRIMDGKVVPTFPNAAYYVQRLEMAEARYPNERTRGTYFPENFVPLEGSGQLQIVDGDCQITPSVSVWVTRGHTPGHQIVVVESEGKTAMFLADACSWAVHLERLAWVPAFDLEPMVSIQTKKRIGDWALKHDAVLIFQHDPTTVMGRVMPGDGPGRFKVEKISAESA